MVQVLSACPRASKKNPSQGRNDEKKLGKTQEQEAEEDIRAGSEVRAE